MEKLSADLYKSLPVVAAGVMPDISVRVNEKNA